MRAISGSLVFLSVLLPVAHAADAQEPPAYLDDRSGPAALIESYYNAINRKEYSRAWSYFGEDKPSPDLDAFEAGFADTAAVELLTGAVSEEGAAGSTFYDVPVAIRAESTAGATSIFAGCYTARLANPQIQGDPFQPMHLVTGQLQPAAEPLEDALPAQCGDGPAPEPVDAVLAQARELFQTVHGDDCRTMPGGEANGEPESHTIAFRYQSDDSGGPERQARLFRFFCDVGAYNENHIYYLWEDIEGLRELQFATPELDVRYENDDFEGKVETIRIIGFTAENRLVNSFYDPQTLTITSHAKWRGVGDASSSGIWLFRDGRFGLVQYDVDASYDGEINPQTVLDYNSGP